jgi:hypothetical protein
MVISRRISVALGAFCLLLGASAQAALAAAPASVTVRVEGVSQTLIPPTTLTTTTSPVVKDGNPADSCTGTSAAGALDLATSGNWNGAWFGGGLGYAVETVAGESHLFEPGAPTNFFWSVWIDNAPSSLGLCGAELSNGDSVLLFPECFSEVEACPAPPNPLGISAPAAAEPGSPITVTVTSHANATGAPSPAVGAAVTAGNVSTTTDSNGHATFALSSPGNVIVHATAPGSIRTESTVCIHNGNDGTCGTSGPGATRGPAPTSYSGPFAVVAKAAGVIDSHVYPHKDAPKVLTGTVLAHTSVASVSLRLRRSYKGRCYAYNGVSTRFVKARCGQGSFVKVSTAASFSYLLPSALAPGRYVLDIEATDVAGNSTALARGTSRIVFYVR